MKMLSLKDTAVKNFITKDSNFYCYEIVSTYLLFACKLNKLAICLPYFFD